MNQNSFQDVFLSSKVHPSHATGFQAVSERSFQPHAAMPQQLLSTFASNSTAIGIDSLLFVGLVLPAATVSIRFRDVGAYPQFAKIDHRLVAVISLIGDDFRKPIFSNLRFGFRVACQLFHVFGRADQGLLHCRRVPGGGTLNRHTHHGAGLHIHCVFQLVSQMRSTIFHRGNLRIRVVGMHPGHCQVNRNSLFFDAKSILASTKKQRSTWHVNQWNLLEIS